MYPISMVKQRLDFGNILLMKARRREDHRMFPKTEGLIKKAEEEEDGSSNIGA